MPRSSRQRAAALEPQIRYTTTADGVSLAYAVVGHGPPIVRVLGHFTHLEVEWEWPDLRRFWESLAERHTVLRYFPTDADIVVRATAAIERFLASAT
jgi:hypothetical protein